VFFFAFVSDWNNFFLPYVVLSDPHQLPITVEAPNERLTIAHGLYGRDGWAA
jgi:ABC-type glycerol-3-phosphate transport system permease component